MSLTCCPCRISVAFSTRPHVGLFPSWVQKQACQLSVQNAETEIHSPVAEECPLASFPRFLPLLGWRRSRPNELIIGQPLASNAVDYGLESVSIVSLPSVESESLFVKIPNQVEWLNTDISSLDCSLQETPKVFNAIGVNMTSDISLSVVNYFMDILGVQVIIGRQGISDKIATCFNRLPDRMGDCVSASISNYLGLNLASLVFHKLLYNERACQEWLWRRLSTPTV